MKNNKTEGTVDIKFAVPSFRYKGKEYKSADVEKAAESGDEEAQAIVANLVKIGSGIVEVLEAPKEKVSKSKAEKQKGEGE